MAHQAQRSAAQATNHETLLYLTNDCYQTTVSWRRAINEGTMNSNYMAVLLCVWEPKYVANQMTWCCLLPSLPCCSLHVQSTMYSLPCTVHHVQSTTIQPDTSLVRNRLAFNDCNDCRGPQHAQRL
jgi:hypothetical protein